MNLSIIKNNNYSIHDITGDLYTILNNQKICINPLLNVLGICCNINSNKVIIYNIDKEYCVYIDKNVNDAFIDIIGGFLIKRNIDINSAYNILLIGDRLQLPEDKYSKLFNLINWPQAEKGFVFFNAVKNFSEKLRNLVLDKKVSLTESYYFDKYFCNDYDDFLDLIPENVTFSEFNEILRNVTEYSKKESKKINKIIDLIKKNCSKLNKEEILNYSQTLRNPFYKKNNKKLNNYIDDFKLPGGVKIDYDSSFEKDEYNLSINFNNLNMLQKKIESLYEKISAKNIKTDLFDHKNLFKNN